MKGNFSELKEQGLDFDGILHSYESKDNNEDEIFDEDKNKDKIIQDKIKNKYNDSENLIEEDQVEDEKQLDEINNEIIEDMVNKNTSSLSNEDYKKVNIIEKEKKQEGEVTI